MAEPVFGLAQSQAIRHVSFCKEKLISRPPAISPGDRYLPSWMAEPLYGSAAAKIGFLISARIPIEPLCLFRTMSKTQKSRFKDRLAHSTNFFNQKASKALYFNQDYRTSSADRHFCIPLRFLLIFALTTGTQCCQAQNSLCLAMNNIRKPC